jgi:hypothetical protein
MRDKKRGYGRFPVQKNEITLDLSSYDLDRIKDPEDFPKEYRDYFTKNGRPDWGYAAPAKFTLCEPYGPLNAGSAYNRSRYHHLDLYAKDMRDLVLRMDSQSFTDVLTFLWLRRKFGYMEEGVDSYDESGAKNLAPVRMFAYFTRAWSGVTPKSSMNGAAFVLLRSYVSRLWGDMEFYFHSNPVRTPPANPFPNLHLGFYDAVLDADECLSLLKKANQDRMTYHQFLDYLINWVEGYNAKYGRTYVVALRQHSRADATVVDIRGGKRRSDSWLGTGRSKLNEDKNVIEHDTDTDRAVEGAEPLLDESDAKPAEDAERVASA